MTRPLRIASLISSATEMLYGIGLGDRVVAVSHECDFPADVTSKPRVTCSHIDSSASSAVIDEAVQQSAKAAEPLYAVDVELLDELRPDLIVTQAQCDVCAVKYDDVVEAVARMETGHDVSILALNPASLGDVFNDIVQLGDACGRREAASDYVRRLRSRVEAIKSTTAGLSDAQRPRTALIEWTEPLMLAGNWMPELLDIAGGRCSLTEPGRHSGYIGWQAVSQYDPEVIVVCPCGFDLDRTVAEAEVLRSLDGWDDLTAVRSDRVYAVDGNAYFNRSGPRLVDSLEILAHLLHPEVVPVPLAAADRRSAWAPLDRA